MTAALQLSAIACAVAMTLALICLNLAETELDAIKWAALLIWSAIGVFQSLLLAAIKEKK